ncbi:MAG: hypothetical protein M0037_08805 [Betaproteobacteria bacterium]|nr:hypothetical protein [Betaproteobacteria bacterium]
MSNPQSHLAYAPHGAGLLCALVYIERQKDIWGWWIGSADGTFPSAFFKLENFFSSTGTAFLATQGSDVYGGWRYDYAARAHELGTGIPIDEGMCHSLERMQDVFFSEWLFLAADPSRAPDLHAYAAAALAVQDVNIRFEGFNRMDHHDPVWTFSSKEMDGAVLEFMMPRWPLQYGKV